jgi:hypothetical protein
MGDGVAGQSERVKDHGDRKAQANGLAPNHQAKPIGLLSIVQVQPLLLAVPELMFCRMPQIAARAKIPNMIAV